MLVFAVSLLHERKSLFWHIRLKKLQNHKEIAQSRKTIPKRKKYFLERETLFPLLIPLKAQYPVIKTLKKSFRLKALLFFISNSEEVWYSVQFFKKLLKLRIFGRYAGCFFDNHAGNFPLEVQKKLRSKRWKK